MSERKRGGLDYTPRAFPGARDPDGPAPGLEDQLIKLGLAESRETKDVRADANPGVHPGANPGAKKRGGLDYTPQAFPGARDPDGPAPGMEERLIQLGLAERGEPKDTRPDVRPGASYSPPPAPAPKQRIATPPPAIPPAPARRERVERPAPSPTPSARIDAQPRRPIIDPSPSPAIPIPRPQPFDATPQPVYVVPPPVGTATASMPEFSQPSAATPAPFLPVVPPEPAPRPAPVGVDFFTSAVPPGDSAARKPTPHPRVRAARGIEQLKKLPNKEDRVRLSVRLGSGVDAKLNELAHLRGLDRNTAVSVAIVQDWVGCFGMGTQSAR